MTLHQRLQPRRGESSFALAVTAIYAVYVFFVIFHHEPWRDEAHVWLAARDMSPRQLFHWLGSAGTPGLWYLIIMPLAKGGCPYLTMSLVHGSLAVALAGVIAYAAPFPRVLRGLLIFSYPLAYEYAVIARAYVLTCLILMLIAVVLGGSRRRPFVLGVLLFLLANANPHGFFFSCIITSALFIEAVWRREYSGATLRMLGIAGIGILLAFLQLLPPPHAQRLEHGAQWGIVNQAFGLAFFPRIPARAWLPDQLISHDRVATALYLARVVLIGWILIGTILLIRRNPFCIYVLVLSIAALFYIFLFRWFQGERHAALILLTVIFVIWVAQSQREQNAVHKESRFDGIVAGLTRQALEIALVCSCTAGAVRAYIDVRYPYSLSKQLAMHLRATGQENETIASYPDSYAGPVLPYLSSSKRFWLVGRQEFGSYMIWDDTWLANLQLSQDEVLRRVERRFPERKFLLLENRPLHDAESHGYRLLFHTSAPHWVVQDEVYFLYEPIEISRRGA